MNSKQRSPRTVKDLISLEGRVVVITGAAGGLGQSFARACIEAGAHVAGIDVVDDPQSFLGLSDDASRSKYFQADVTNGAVIEATIQEVIDHFGSIHGCITCAGVAGEAPFHEYQESEVRRIMDINFFGSYFVAQSVVRHFVARQILGSIVFISSVASHQANRSHPVSAYGATKFAVRGLTQQVAAEYADRGIRANSISPGPMMTDMTRKLAAGNPEVYRNLCRNIMLGRLGEPEELNGAAVFLLSDASSFVTGEDILIDGGQGHL